MSSCQKASALSQHTTITTENRRWQRQERHVSATCSLQLKTARHVTSCFPSKPLGLLPCSTLLRWMLLTCPIHAAKKHIFSPLKKIFTNPAVMYVNSPVLLCSSYSTPPLAPLTDRNKPAVWAATPREAG